MRQNNIKIKQNIYNIVASPLIWYRNKYLPPYYHFKKPPKGWISDFDEASNIIYDLLCSDEPCLIARYGSNEFMCMENFMKGKHPFWFLRNIFPFWVNKSLIHSMVNNAGFFSPDGYKAFSKFADLLYQDAKLADIVGCWFKNQEIVEKEMNYKLFWIQALEPWWAKKPWTRYLKGKKVLVIHPFAESIKKQYTKREHLFENPDVLPELRSLTVIKAVQSIGGDNNGFHDWFEALHFMETQIDNCDYDIALIGCGAYGLPLAAHCKKQGKKAIHLGGALQLLFGIYGNRWINRPEFSQLLNNPFWIRPKENEKPLNANSVEGACYW